MRSQVVILCTGLAEISGVEIVGEHYGPPVFVVPSNGVLRNVRIECNGRRTIVTKLPGFHKSF